MMAMLGVVFERHGGFPETEWDHPAPTRHRPPTEARGPFNTVAHEDIFGVMT